MLVAFEGQDGAGKTALLTAVHHELARARVNSLVVEEFSDGHSGHRLVEAVGHDKFLRPVPGEQATTFTRVFDQVADLYYLDEQVIGPALGRCEVILKDRHYDTVLYALVPILLDAGAIPSHDRALSWLRGLLSELRHRPDLTVYVDAPLDVRSQRIASRTRHLAESRAAQVSEDDCAVFEARGHIIERLLAEQDRRRLVIDNAYRPVEHAVAEVVASIQQQLVATGDLP